MQLIEYVHYNLLAGKLAGISNDRGMKVGSPITDIYVPGFASGYYTFYGRNWHRLGWHWNLYKIQAPMAWEITSGKSSVNLCAGDRYPSNNLTHPDLGNVSRTANSGNGKFVTYPFGTGDHGETVICMAVAKGDNDGTPTDRKGMVGTCPNCTGLCLNGPQPQFATYDIDNSEANKTWQHFDAVNISYGYGKGDLNDVVYKQAIDSGIVVISAAGNHRESFGKSAMINTSGGNVLEYRPAANYPGAFAWTDATDIQKDVRVLCVGQTEDEGVLRIGPNHPDVSKRCQDCATTSTYWQDVFIDSKKEIPTKNWVFSEGVDKFNTNTNPVTRRDAKELAHIDIVAPGRGLLVAGGGPSSTNYGNSKTVKYHVDENGTSQAAPTVMGIVGLMYSVYPKLGVNIDINNDSKIDNGAAVQRKVYDVLTFTTDKLQDSNNISLPASGATTRYSRDLRDANDNKIGDYQFDYVVQTNDVMKRSWAQRMGFGRVNAYRAVAHSIANKGSYKYTTSGNLTPWDFTTNGYVNENGRALKHFGHWANATQSVFETAGNVFTGEPVWKNNNGKTLLEGSGISLEVPENCILAIDGIVTTDNPDGGNKIATQVRQSGVTYDHGKILISGYLDGVSVEGRIKVSDLVVNGGGSVGTGLLFKNHAPTDLPVRDPDNMSEVYGTVNLQNHGMFTLDNNALCLLQPGSHIDMKGTEDIHISNGAKLVMKSASVITGNTGRKIIVENGGKLIVEGENVDIFTEVEVLDGGQFILEENSLLRLDRFTVQSGGTIQCKGKSSLYLNKISAPGAVSDNFCYGKFLVEGTASKRVVINGRRINICNEISQGATINIRGDLTNTSKNRLTLQYADISNVMIQGMDAYTPDAIDNVIFKLSRDVTQSYYYDYLATGLLNDSYRLSLQIASATHANPSIIGRTVRVSNCQFIDNLTDSEFTTLTSTNWNNVVNGKYGLEIRMYDFASVENSLFKHIAVGLNTALVGNLSVRDNTFSNCNLGFDDWTSSIFACSNIIESVRTGSKFVSSRTVQLFNNTFSINEIATVGISSSRILFRSNSFSEYLNAIQVNGGLANLSYRKSTQADYERFGRNIFSVTNPTVTPYPNRFVEFPYDLPDFTDIYLDLTGVLWTACGFNSFSNFATYHVSGNPARTLLNGGFNFWHDPNNATGLIRVPATWGAPGAPLNESLPPIADCNGVSESALCAGCSALGNPPSYAVAGGPMITSRTKKDGAQILENTLSDIMQERAHLSDELAAIRLPDSLRAFITRTTPGSNDEEFLRTGKYLYQGMAYERLSEFDSARSAYHSITSLQHKSSDSLVAAWRLQWIDVETGNWGSLTHSQAEIAYYERVYNDLRHKHSGDTSSMTIAAPIHNGNGNSNKISEVNTNGAVVSTELQEIQSNTETGNTLASEDFDPNVICEQTVCKIKTFRIGRLYPQPVTNGMLSLDAESNENATNITAELYSIIGQKLSTVWEGNLKKGASTFTMTLQDVVSGSYILYLKNNKGEIVDYNRVVVAEGQR
jgi:hypothetical protein